MPEKNTIERARKDAREGKAPSTQAVHEEIKHKREGKHGARSTKQAIAIGLSKARRASIQLPPPEKGKASEETRRQAARALAKGLKSAAKSPSPTRSQRHLRLSSMKARKLHLIQHYLDRQLPARESAAGLIEGELPKRLYARKEKRVSEVPLEKQLVRGPQEVSAGTGIAFPRRKHVDSVSVSRPD